MMLSSLKIAGTGRLGAPKYLSEKEMMVFKVHDFENLEKKDYETSNVSCHGHEWYIKIYPWGRIADAKEKEMISAFLCIVGPPTTGLKANWDISIAGVHNSSTNNTFCEAEKEYGWTNFVQRSDALTKLDTDGTLNISVGLQVWSDKKAEWQPNSGIRQNLTRLYQKDEGMDVTFLLGTDRVRAHRYVLAIQCPILHEMTTGQTSCPEVEIEGADPDLFATMIRYMYFEALPDDFDLAENGIGLLKLADRFGYSYLKLRLEVDVVESGMISIESAADMLLLADAHSCALLKETAMDLVVGNPSKIAKTAGWTVLKESPSLLAEVYEYERPLTVYAAKSHSGNENPELLSVSALRKWLADRGLDVDGTKEMLVKRFKTGEDEEQDE